MNQDWRHRMKQLKLEDIRAKAPAFFEASGGYSMQVNPYSDTTANGLTRCIIDFLQFKGHYANRISTQGQARAHKIERFNIFTEKVETVSETVQWTKGSTRKGTPDIDSIIHGRPVKIEVKVGKDYMKDEQKKERAKIESAGGVYFIARDFPSFLTWYDHTFIQSK